MLKAWRLLGNLSLASVTPVLRHSKRHRGFSLRMLTLCLHLTIYKTCTLENQSCCKVASKHSDMGSHAHHIVFEYSPS